jgi:hypothetical protein
MADPLGVGGREQDGHRATLGLPHERRPFDALGLQHGADVVHPGLERDLADRPARHPHAALVEHDQPGELGEHLAVPAERRERPVGLEVRVGAHRPHERDVAVADDRVGDVHVSAGREAHVEHARTIANGPIQGTDAHRRRSLDEWLVRRRQGGVLMAPCGLADLVDRAARTVCDRRRRAARARGDGLDTAARVDSRSDHGDACAQA